jgi:hypothetical protein
MPIAVKFNPYLIVVRTRPDLVKAFGPRIMIEANRQTREPRLVFTEEIMTTPLPTHLFIRMNIKGVDHVLRCEGTEKQEEYYGPYLGHQPYGLAFMQDKEKPDQPGVFQGQFVRSVAVTWRALSPDGYDEMGRLIKDRTLANEIEFTNPLITEASCYVHSFRDTGEAGLTSGLPFPDVYDVERKTGPFTEDNLVRDIEWKELLEAEAHDRDDCLTPSLLQAINRFFAERLRDRKQLLLDPMLGTGDYLKEAVKQSLIAPNQMVVGDQTPEILGAYQLEGATKHLSDAENIFEQLGEKKKQVGLVVLRGCNFKVVTQAKARQIFSHVYDNLLPGTGLIVTGITRVLFDSNFIMSFPGATILQRVTWNTFDALLPFYVVMKEA